MVWLSFFNLLKGIFLTIMNLPLYFCANSKEHEKEEILDHLCCDEIFKTYSKWTYHGEVKKKTNVSHSEKDDVDMDD